MIPLSMELLFLALELFSPITMSFRVKVKVVLVHTTKAYRGRVGSTSLILSLSTRCTYFYLLIVLIVYKFGFKNI